MFESDFGKRFLSSYSILLLSLWLFDLGLADGPSLSIKPFVSSAKWYFTVPAVVGAFIAVIIHHLSQPPTQRVMPSLAEPKRTPVAPYPPLTIKTEPTKPKPEERAAEKTPERSAFPPVEKTRGAQEALEASLDEF
ncbi:MAG: hypothetical protein EOP06_05195 [Proteobacteria bacterium]|nr:MAG: hypothetical protein EOP06_05195 [Pseudomonadota bacterium]